MYYDIHHICIYSVRVYFYTHVHIHTCFNTSISVGKRQHHIWPRNSAAVVAMGSNRTGAQCDSRTISLRPPTRHTWTRTVRTGLCVLHQAFWPQHIAMVKIVKQKLERFKISKLRGKQIFPSTLYLLRGEQISKSQNCKINDQGSSEAGNLIDSCRKGLVWGKAQLLDWRWSIDIERHHISDDVCHVASSLSSNFKIPFPKASWTHWQLKLLVQA